MRVLVVLAHKNSPRGKQLGERFVKHVRAAFAACPIFQERLDVLVRSYNQLEDFLPPAAGETDVPDIVKVRDRLTCLDGIEFVFIDGDDNLLPWTQPAAPLLKLLHLCMISGKIVFGCSCAVQLLAYLVNVGPVQVPVLNGKGRGGALGGFNGGSGRPASASTGAGSSSSAGGGGGVLLERETGDLFRFDARRGAWAPVGNVGVHCSVGAGLGEAGVSTGLNRSDGIGPCELTQRARYHTLFEEVWPAKLIVPETNEWHCHLPSFDAALRLPTGHFEVKALATSRLGVQVVECRNAVMLQFRVDDMFPQTVRMLHNFVHMKVKLCIGEGIGEQPSRVLELAARDPRHTDLVQQVLRSLAPVHTGPFGTAPAPARPSTADPAVTFARSAGRSAQAQAPTGADTAGGPMGTRPGSAVSEPAKGTQRHTISVSASSAELGNTFTLGNTSATLSLPRPSSARSEGTPAPSRAAYQVAPNAALTYLKHSGDALKAHADRVDIGRTQIAFAGMPGMAQEVPLYTTRPPRPTSASSARGAAAKAGERVGESSTTADAPDSRRSQPELVPRVYGAEMSINGPAGARPSRSPSRSDVAKAASLAEEPLIPPVVRVKNSAKAGRPFSNYQKHQAKTQALKGHTIHITSVGPYISRPEQRNLDDQGLRYRSIHKEAFKPAGLWDKYEPPLGGWGFAAAGFVLPDDLPETAKRFGSFYNTHLHQFRATAPKGNIYM